MTTHALLALHCLSHLSAGAGKGAGGIDLPIQRERHTGFPIVAGSGIKGVLRDAVRTKLTGGDPKLAKQANSNPRVVALFGPVVDGDDDRLGLGALSVGDAHLVLFPIRSLAGLFVYATCPSALDRLRRSQAVGEATGIPKCEVSKGKVALADPAACAKGEDVVLEDSAFALDRSVGPAAQAIAKDLHPLLFSTGDLGIAESDFSKRFAVLHDEDFGWYAKHATQVDTRIALDPATKTVKDGALFTQESVPPEAVFVSLITCEVPRVKEGEQAQITTAAAALAAFKADLPRVLQVGSDATVGKGLCATTLSPLSKKA
jgi:CRISPR-associated protein Cmr4